MPCNLYAFFFHILMEPINIHDAILPFELMWLNRCTAPSPLFMKSYYTKECSWESSIANTFPVMEGLIHLDGG